MIQIFLGGAYIEYSIEYSTCCSFYLPYIYFCIFQVADQQAAMFGQCCFNVGDVNATLGTGTFIDTNTGNKPHASIAGKIEKKTDCIPPINLF